MGLFSALYAFALTCRRFSYAHIKKPGKLPAKVISIGNLTLGGTGKTPAVMSLAQEAKKRGFTPCILTRGYRGKSKGTCFVGKGGKPLMNAQQAGDEAFLMAEILDGIPIVKGKDRYKSGLFALNSLRSKLRTPNSELLFILDDGFQHWRLHRDIDILLIDAINPFGNEKLFPEGIMREPFSAIKRANIIVITKADMAAQGTVHAITDKIRKYNPEAPIFTASHRPTGLAGISGESKGLDSLRNKRIYAFSGIANPAYFRSTLTLSGARTVEFRKFRDHHIYRQKDMDEIKKDASGLDIVTTEKDLVKLKELQIPENLSALKIEFSIDDDFYNNIFRRVQ
ncbi:MAG TPA: tetraacyldisaccharide 4'-kinase [Nitrospirae bacterium]|nr:tetraacyldisaccharide 4'-kinase [Nitrospirota bacterium]